MSIPLQYAILGLLALIFAPLYLALLSRSRIVKRALEAELDASDLRVVQKNTMRELASRNEAYRALEETFYHSEGNVRLVQAERQLLRTQLDEAVSREALLTQEALDSKVAEKSLRGEVGKLRAELEIAEFWRLKLVNMVEGLEQVEGQENAEKRFRLVERGYLSRVAILLSHIRNVEEMLTVSIAGRRLVIVDAPQAKAKRQTKKAA